MSQAHAIDYRTVPQKNRLDTPAARRAVCFSERDFLGAALPPAIEKVLPAAVRTERDGLLDFSDQLGVPWPATLPTLLSGTRDLAAAGTQTLGEGAGAVILLILSGAGELTVHGETVELATGDIACVPGSQGARVVAGTDGIRYFHVDDSPAARYAGWQVTPDERTPFTHYPAELLSAKLDEYERMGITASGVFLSNENLTQEKLATPILFAHLNRLLPGAANTVHSHTAAALTYVIQGGNNCYSLLGPGLGDDRAIVDPIRVEWEDGQVSLTPPILWHGHFNQGDETILSLVIQLSGFYYNDRTMNFRLADRT